MAKDIV